MPRLPHLPRVRPYAVAALGGLLLLALPGTAAASASASPSPSSTAHGRTDVRFATFNASLNRATQGELQQDLATPDDQQARNVAEIIQRSRPDVLLVNEFDYDAKGVSARLFQRNYLSVPHHGARAISYRYHYTAPSNTGIPTGVDLDHDGKAVTQLGQPGYDEDAQGFGEFPGQYGMVVYSKYPIDRAHARTFQKFLWKDMPHNAMPIDPATGKPWYDAKTRAVLRLSSKSHWDLPIRVGGRTVHFLASHPTPPTFDGPEDRNGTRNHDEIRFWSDYVQPSKSGYVHDDEGHRGGLARGASFVIAGDNNADPYDGDSYRHAARQYLTNPRIDAGFFPTSAGAVESSRVQGGLNKGQRGPAKYDTADFSDAPPYGPGNLHVDYVLPSYDLRVRGGGVFWPRSTSPLARLVWAKPDGTLPSSDHKLVWLDLRA